MVARRWNKAKHSLAALMAFGGSVATPVSAASPSDLMVLQKIEPGQWDIRPLDVRDGGRTMCITNPATFLTLGHPGMTCSRIDITNTAHEAVVHYRCPGAGSGQTSLRLETPRLVQIETQGILRQMPFQMRFEARRTGACLPLVR